SRGRVNNSWKAGLKTNGKLLNDQNKARFKAANENFGFELSDNLPQVHGSLFFNKSNQLKDFSGNQQSFNFGAMAGIQSFIPKGDYQSFTDKLLMAPKSKLKLGEESAKVDQFQMDTFVNTYKVGANTSYNYSDKEKKNQFGFNASAAYYHAAYSSSNPAVKALQDLEITAGLTGKTTLLRGDQLSAMVNLNIYKALNYPQLDDSQKSHLAAPDPEAQKGRVKKEDVQMMVMGSYARGPVNLQGTLNLDLTQAKNNKYSIKLGYDLFKLAKGDKLGVFFRHTGGNRGEGDTPAQFGFYYTPKK
ncbi:MAG: hypothetical protein AAFQ98_27130, partial [Bacteroidota bacterium]